MKLKKSRTEGQCAAMRCKEPAEYLCPKHAVEEPEAAPAEDGGYLPTKVQAQLTTDRGNLQEALQLAQILPLDTQEGVDMAGEMVAMAMNLKKEKEEQRRSVTDPLNAAVKTINSWFRPVTETCDSIVSTLKKRVADALVLAQQKQDEALKAIEESGGKASPEHLMVAHNTPQKPDNMTISQVPVGYVVDFQALPDAYKVANNNAIQVDVKRGIAIPGIEVRMESKVIARS